MAKGQFGTLLRIRKRQEELRALAFADARREVRTAERERDELSAWRREMFDEAGTRARAVFDPGDVRLYYRYERHLARLIDDKDAQIVQLSGTAEQRRMELDDAMKRRRIIEKLLERKERQAHEDMRKAEQKSADETASKYAALARRRDMTPVAYLEEGA